ncbi:MAG: hypothetical protein Q7S12_04715, partial [bacterium]|nr:hypothetical protein [bacterium]
MRENQEGKTPYQKYLESGGIFDEKEYDNSLLREKNVTQSERQLNKQHELAAINLVEYAGLGLDNNNKAIVL